MKNQEENNTVGGKNFRMWQKMLHCQLKWHGSENAKLAQKTPGMMYRNPESDQINNVTSSQTK